MSGDPKQPLSSSQLAAESAASITPNAKDMMERIWAVAKLLAEAANRETNSTWANQMSEKTQH